MSRFVVSFGAVLALCLVLAGCSNESAEAADELGVKPGRRDVPAETRKPPGPPDGRLVSEEESETTADSDQD